MNKHTRISPRIAGTILLSTLLLSACGQKGPLYMPEKKASSATTNVTQSMPTQTETMPSK
ncbi:LPS translocon maturation chaperone LptM [Undibacterium baiyunense]|uniref:Lipoprotein n=1 Tax=Undibacterium baiyunense TaxID=2828731 RepID=A0A941DGE5_9BURK|nr:lipoprotein [Undibacterium baiyunense]